ncbi:hypothetical protein [Tardiphaga sp. 841_E9_N1_2]|uniref:hypothetical protein n=1 Tax=Tardiphaga sp. 841_E9_N1_2 TaxID=3240762 RepID=UPI003F28F246
MISELAFQACTTEERALGAILASIDPRKAPTMILAVKLQVKRELQAIIANPSAYLPKVK